MTAHITIADIARKAHVSVATVSRALNHSPRVNPNTAAKIQLLAKAMGYHPNRLAQSIRRQTTQTLAVIIPDILDPFFSTVTRAIADEALRNQYDTLILNTDDHPDNEQAAINLALEKQVAGLIIVPTDAQQDYPTRLAGTPTVFIDRAPLCGAFDQVLVDNVAAADQVVTQLLLQGTRHLGVMTRPVGTTSPERVAGVKQALTRQQQVLDPAAIVTAWPDSHNVPQLTRQLLVNQHCDGLFVADNRLLLQVLTALPALDRQCYLGAFDNNPWLETCRYPVTTIQQPTAQIATTAVRLLQARVAQPNRPVQTLRLAATLVTR